jgi:hypothetical protein
MIRIYPPVTWTNSHSLLVGGQLAHGEVFEINRDTSLDTGCTWERSVTTTLYRKGASRQARYQHQG